MIVSQVDAWITKALSGSGAHTIFVPVGAAIAKRLQLTSASCAFVHYGGTAQTRTPTGCSDSTSRGTGTSPLLHNRDRYGDGVIEQPAREAIDTRSSRIFLKSGMRFKLEHTRSKMDVFANYSRYYDLLYRDKPYQDESDYIRRLISAHIPNASTLIELGCGTGIHAEHFARSGMVVHGVDLSKWMLGSAAARRSALPDDIAKRLHFSHGDVRNVRLGVQADAVISLFHVMSYQSGNVDLQAMFATARTHMRPGGVFIFDVWYGPAVLSDRPVVRIKELEDDEVKITRIAQPAIHPSLNLVDVNYRIIACEKKMGRCSETEETHRMRYLFSPEVELLATQAGFTVVDAHEWMSGRAPGFDTWSVCFVCRA